MSTVVEPVRSRWLTDRRFKLNVRRDFRRHQFTAALCLAAYGLLFVLCALLRPLGLDDRRFIALLDVASAVPPLLAGGIALLAYRSALTARPRLGWLLLACGWLSWGSGEVVWGFYEVVLQIAAPFPSAADVGYLLLIPFSFAGILVLMPREARFYQVADLINIVGTALIGSSFIAYFVLYEIAIRSSAPALEKALAAAYPLGDILLLSVVAFAFQRSWKGASGIVLSLLFVGVALFMAADLSFAILELHGEYKTGTLLTESAWVLSFLVMAYAGWLQVAWEPNYRSLLDGRSRSPWMQLSPGSLLVLFVVAVTGVAFGLHSPIDRDRAMVLIAGSILLTALRRVVWVLLLNIRIIRETGSELNRAAEVQTLLLPPTAHAGDGYTLGASYVPSREVSGDFYDWWEEPGRLHLALGDVMGKGVGAALLASAVRSALRGGVSGRSPADGMTHASASMQATFEQAGAFATLFYAQFDPASMTLSYVDCGHGLAFVVTRTGEVVQLHAGTFPLGALDLGGDVEQVEVRLGVGDALFVSSDGLLDVIPELTQPDVLERLAAGKSPSQTIEDVLTVSRGAGVPTDDITILMIQVTE